MASVAINLKSSSNISGARYDKELKTLYVWFKSGSQYKYSNVPSELVNEWVEAPSVGKFFCAEIRKYPQLYPYERVE